MTSEEILDMVRRCNLRQSIELIPGEAYLFNRKFLITDVYEKKHYMPTELIVLVKNNKKVGGIYRMGFKDIHVVIEEKYRGQHIMSNFLKSGILAEIWPENTRVELCGVYSRAEFEKKKHLASLCHMEIKNAEKIETQLSDLEQRKRLYLLNK